MKTKLIVGSLLCMAASAHAAITMSFSSSSAALGNFQNGAGSADNARMVWGIVVDSAGDGFDATALNPYLNGFGLAANATGIQLSTTTGGLCDDVLYVASAVMAQNAAVTDGAPIGQNRILSFTGLTLNAGLGVNTGDKMAIIWFDTLALGGTATLGEKYGLYELPHTDAGGGLFVDLVPLDGTNNAFSPAFAGVDPPKSMGFAAGAPIPEPSAALLGALGALGLLRRRRI